MNNRRYHLPENQVDRMRYLKPVCKAQRGGLSFTLNLPQPFLDLIIIGENLSICYTYYFEFAFPKSEITKKLKEHIKDLKLALDNFDYLMAKRFEKELLIEEKKPLMYRRSFDRILSNVYHDITFDARELQEWCLDTDEKIEMVYVTMRAILNTHSHKDEAVIENALYASILRYKVSRYRELHKFFKG